MRKRGISAVIAIVLIILIVVAGVGILWGLIMPMIRDNLSAGVYDADLIIETDGGYTYFDSEKGVACVQVRRLSGGKNLSRIDVLFTYNGTTLDDKGNFSEGEIPGMNEAKTKCFNLTAYSDGIGGYVAPETIKIVPIYFDGSGDVVGGVVSTTRGGGGNGNFPDDGVAQKIGGCGSTTIETVCVGTGSVNTITTTPTDVGGTCQDDVEEVIESCDSLSGQVCYEDACVDFIPLYGCGILSMGGSPLYRLMNDILDASGTCFDIQTPYIRLDLNGYNITGDGTGSGVFIGDRYTVEVSNGKISNFEYGISMGGGSGNNLIENNEVCGNTQDFYCDDSSGSPVEWNGGVGNTFGNVLTICDDSSGWPIMDSHYSSCSPS
jgi:hypothetical protein